jgi:hypothetical protein
MTATTEPPASVREYPQPANGALAWITAFMLAVSMVNTLYRPDPTVVICVLGIYTCGRSEASPDALGAYALATALSLCIDALWWLTDSTILVGSLDTAEDFNQLPRTIQLPICLTALNIVYKVIVIVMSTIALARRCRGSSAPFQAPSAER